MRLVLDAGALVALERGDGDLVAVLKSALRDGNPPVTHGGVIGQVWRGSRRQAGLARLLPAVEVVALDLELGKRAGALLARARLADVIDAAVVLLAADGDSILTSDPGDLARLARAAGVDVDIVAL